MPHKRWGSRSVPVLCHFSLRNIVRSGSNIILTFLLFFVRADPRRRNPRKSLINIDSLREAWESEICTDDNAQPRSAPLLLRYVVQTKSFLACRLVKNIQAARANPANLALPAIDIRKVLDEDTPDMAGINLRNLLPHRGREGTSESVPAQSTPARSKRARVESSAGPSRPATSAQPGPSASAAQRAAQVTQLGNVVRSDTPVRHGIRSAGEGPTRLWAPRLEYRGANPVEETDCILPVGVDRSATVASALSQAVRLPLDMEEWRKAADEELISNLRRGLLMVNTKDFKLHFSCKRRFLPFLICSSF